MIYLLRKHGIISVPIIREAYIICEADIIALAISSVTARNGYHCKNPLLSSRQKRVFTWLGWRDSNPRDDGVKVRCLTAWRQPNIAYGGLKKSPLSVQWGFYGVNDGT